MEWSKVLKRLNISIETESSLCVCMQEFYVERKISGSVYLPEAYA